MTRQQAEQILQQAGNNIDSLLDYWANQTNSEYKYNYSTGNYILYPEFGKHRTFSNDVAIVMYIFDDMTELRIDTSEYL